MSCLNDNKVLNTYKIMPIHVQSKIGICLPLIARLPIHQENFEILVATGELLLHECVQCTILSKPMAYWNLMVRHTVSRYT